MAILHIPDQNLVEKDPAKIRSFFNARQIVFEQWPAPAQLSGSATQEEVLESYAEVLQPYMAAHGYQTADVINVTPDNPNIEELSRKFLSEHTHSEDEVRFFVDGEGLFWFNLENGVDPPFCLICQKGDLISVPAGTKHWFDFGPKKFVKCIRVFIEVSGWTPHYTQSGLDTSYNALGLSA
jgi:1,2-dihydroxy-3-keto-5-methylthiopentene dioxygenase